LAGCTDATEAAAAAGWGMEGLSLRVGSEGGMARPPDLDDALEGDGVEEEEIDAAVGRLPV
jgi:hypothetical protein